MGVPLDFLVSFFLLHLLGDWVFQPRRLAVEKSRNMKALGEHMAIYAFFMMPLGAMMGIAFFPWVIFNLLCHASQDYVLYNIVGSIPNWEGHPHINDKLWVAIGIDQCLHFLVAVISYAVVTTFS
jgi:hypothetical protein